MDKQNGPTLKKVFIQRDYSQGTSIRFQTKFPQELEGFISSQILINFIDTLNSMYADAEQMNGKICLESCFACLTAYLTYLCCESSFDKCLKGISQYIDQQNDTVFKSRGIYIVDPIDRGLRVIEIVINEQRAHVS